MADLARFEPIYPEHAIERCSATVAFSQPVPDKFFAAVKAKAAELLAPAGLFPQLNEATLGVQIDMATNRITPMSGASAPLMLSSPQSGITARIFPNLIAFETTSYVRWAPFIGQFEEFIVPLLTRYDEISSVSLVQLDYFDRFYWSGQWEDINYSELLQVESPLLARRPAEAVREWHSHAGWFDHFTDYRRLFNVNVDVQEQARAGRNEPAPSVGILTMAQDRSMVTDGNGLPMWPEGRPAVAVLEEQHAQLHRLLASLITAKTAKEIGLRFAP